MNDLFRPYLRQFIFGILWWHPSLFQVMGRSPNSLATCP
jgi:hypothetical protein